MLFEVCVDTIAGAKAAMRGGAGRIELCSALSEGGLTPSAGLMQEAASLNVPVYAMIRPRAGLFHFSTEEQAIMETDIDRARSAGLAGVVLGAQDTSGALDAELLSRLSDRSTGMGRTLHRVIDVVPDPLAALDICIALGFDRVLTSGAESLAPEGAEMIAAMVRRAENRLSIMPGCGLTPENVGELVRSTGVKEVHAACSRPAPGDPAFSDFDPKTGRMETSEAKVQAMVAALENT